MLPPLWVTPHTNIGDISDVYEQMSATISVTTLLTWRGVFGEKNVKYITPSWENFPPPTI